MRKLREDYICVMLVQNLLSSCLLSTDIKIKIHKTIIFLVVLYTSETWPLTMREEDRLKVFENMVLRTIFGSNMDKIIQGQRKLHNVEFTTCTL
jgi:hypothetical protein